MFAKKKGLRLKTRIKQEQSILQNLDHPFIIKMVRHDKDEKRDYLLLQHVEGVDFYDTLRQLDVLDVKQA